MKRNFLRKIPAVLVMAGIFYLSSLPENDPFLNSVRLSSRIKHIVAYFTLGISFCIWIPCREWFKKTILWCLLVIALCTIFGIFDEFHQSFVPGRSCEGFICFSKDLQKLNVSSNNLHDIVSDLIGATAATIMFLSFVVVQKFRNKK